MSSSGGTYRLVALLMLAGICCSILSACSRVASVPAERPAASLAATSAPLASSAPPQDVARRYFEQLRDGRDNAAAMLLVPGADSPRLGPPRPGQVVSASKPRTFSQSEIPELLVQHPTLKSLGVGPETTLVELGVSWPSTTPGRGGAFVLLTQTSAAGSPWRIIWLGGAPAVQGP
jgi:hypothetical protein